MQLLATGSGVKEFLGAAGFINASKR